MISSEDIQQKNTKDNFKFSFEKAFMDFVIDRMGSNENFKSFIMKDMMN